MPSRIIKESICSSEQIAALSQAEEIFFYRLMVNCDDYGLLDARPAILRAKCFPLVVDKVKDKDIEKWLLALKRQSLIILYTHNGQPYLKMATWDKHQRIRAHKSKYPFPKTDDSNLLTNDSNLLTSDGQPLTDVAVIQSNPNPIRIQSENEYTNEFELFWNEYPRKTEKKKAFKAWLTRINNKTSHYDIIQAAKNYALDCIAKKTEAQFIKHPATFIGPNEPFKEYVNLPPPKTSPLREMTDDELKMEALAAEMGVT